MKREEKVMQPSMMNEGSEYPYGLILNLEEEQLAKLGLEGLPEVGTYLMVSARVEVVGNSTRDNGDGVCRCLTLQVQEMSLDKAKGKDAAEVLYK